MNNEKILEKYKLEKEFYTTLDIATMINRTGAMVSTYYKNGVLGEFHRRAGNKLIWKREIVEAFLIEWELYHRHATPVKRIPGQRAPRKKYGKKYQQLDLLEVNENEST